MGIYHKKGVSIKSIIIYIYQIDYLASKFHKTLFVITYLYHAFYVVLLFVK